MTIKLIIKGNGGEAIFAARKRGISLSELSPQKAYTVTYAECDSKHERRVIAWFCEPPNEAPFPHGSLLHYYGISGEEREAAQ